MSIYYPSDDCLVNDITTESGTINIKALDPLLYDDISSTISINNASAASSGVVTLTTQTLGDGTKNIKAIKINNGTQINSISTDGLFSASSDNVLSTQKATKSYVDNLAYGNVSWQQPVKDFWDASLGLPISPNQYDRAICSGSGNGWIKNYIYTYIGTSWTGAIPAEGWTVYVDTPNNTWTFNGTDWVRIGITIDHYDLMHIGTNTHANIDTHISNTNTAHFSQDLKTTGNVSFNSTQLNSTEESSDYLTGCLKTAGGVAISKTCYAKLLYVASSASSTSTITGAAQIVGGLAVGENITCGGNVKISGTETVGTLHVTGGMTIDGNITGNINGNDCTMKNLHITDTTTSVSSFTVGALIVDGGIGIAKNVYIGERLFVTGSAYGISQGSAGGQIQYSSVGVYGLLNTASAQYSIDNSNANASKMIVKSPNGLQTMQIITDQNLGLSQLYSTASNYIELYCNSIKQAALNGTGSLELFNAGRLILNNSSVQTTISSNINGELVIPSFRAGLSSYINGNLNVKKVYDYNGGIEIANQAGGANLDLLNYGNGGSININPSSNGTGTSIFMKNYNSTIQTIASNLITSAVQCSITITTDATTSNNGALLVAGGVSINKNIHIGQSTYKQFGIFFNSSAFAFNQYDQNDINITFNTGSSTNLHNCFMTRVGRWVTIYIFAVSGVSNANAAYTSPINTIPTNFVPLGLGGIDCSVTVTNNNVSALGRCIISPYGALTFYRDYPTTTFQNNSCLGTTSSGISISYLTN